MNNPILKHIDAVHHRTQLLQQQVSQLPIQPRRLTTVLNDLTGVLDGLRSAHADLMQQTEALNEHRQQLETEHRHYQDLFNLAPDGYLLSDVQGVIKAANIAIADLLQHPQALLLNQPLSTFLPAKNRFALYAILAQINQVPPAQSQPPQPWATQMLTRTGTVIEVAITLSMSHDHQDMAQLHWLIRDVTQQKQVEAEIHHQAFHDQLTELPNRNFLNTYLPKTLAQAERQGSQVAIAFLDLDRFKQINDTLGHGVGDQLLYQVAQRLAYCLRAEDLLVRWGGDEFILVFSRLTTAATIAHTYDRILESLNPPFAIEEHQLHIGLSIGIALFPQDGQDANTLLHHADQALYQAKHAGRHTYRFYQPAAHPHAD